MKQKRIFIALTAISLFLSLTGSCKTGPDSAPAEDLLQVHADAGITYQTIEGFGGSNAWTSLKGNDETKTETVRLLFSKTDGIGLSILRTRIPFRENPGDYRDGFIVTDENGDYAYTENGGVKSFSFNWDSWEAGHTAALISQIDALGTDGPENLKVMATPWTPPNLWKTGYPDATKPAYAGTLDPAHYADYADILADFALGYQSAMGKPLYAISVQNEPDYVPTGYESCAWTAVQIRDFLKILKPRFEQKGVGSSLKIIAAESMHFEEDMVLPALNDTEAAAAIDIVGVHQYDHDEESNMAAKALKNVAAAGKTLWETEVSSGDANDSSITDGVYWAKLIHLDMTLADVNAFLYWWLWSTSQSKGALISFDGDTMKTNKRLYTMGQFSRFVRPGWKRVDITDNPVPGFFLSAFKNPAGDEMAIVAVSQRVMETETSISISGISGIGDIETWLTDETRSLEKVDSGSVSGTTVTASFPAQSVSTILLNLE